MVANASACTPESIAYHLNGARLIDHAFMDKLLKIKQLLALVIRICYAHFNVHCLFNCLLNRMSRHQSALSMGRCRLKQFHRPSRHSQVMNIAFAQSIRLLECLIHICDMVLKFQYDQLILKHRKCFAFRGAGDRDTIKRINKRGVTLTNLQITLLVHRQNDTKSARLKDR
ncbi:hypothetical protein D9M68_801860 [compost metagenome]